MEASNADIERIEAVVVAELDARVAGVAARLAAAGSPECADCGATIERERREAAPFARRCVGCQTRFEHATRRL